MGWGMGIGIGWPNASASAGPPVPQESYTFYNCVGEEYNNTNQYPTGSFTPGYRVVINDDKYGYITEAIPSTPGGYNISNLPIGDVDNRCNDSEIQLSLALLSDVTQYKVRVSGYVYAGGLPVASENNTLFLNIYYYAAILDPEGGSAGFVNGNVAAEITSYNMLTEELTSLIDVNAFTLPPGYSPDYTELTVTSFSLGNTLLGPYDTGESYPNKFVTTYGNVWSFLWPIEP